MTCRTLALAALLVLPASGVNENDAFSQAKEIESIPASLELSFEYQGDPLRHPGARRTLPCRPARLWVGLVQVDPQGEQTDRDPGHPFESQE